MSGRVKQEAQIKTQKKGGLNRNFPAKIEFFIDWKLNRMVDGWVSEIVTRRVGEGGRRMCVERMSA